MTAPRRAERGDDDGEHRGREEVEEPLRAPHRVAPNEATTPASTEGTKESMSYRGRRTVPRRTRRRRRRAPGEQGLGANDGATRRPGRRIVDVPYPPLRPREWLIRTPTTTLSSFSGKRNPRWSEWRPPALREGQGSRSLENGANRKARSFHHSSEHE